MQARKETEPRTSMVKRSLPPLYRQPRYTADTRQESAEMRHFSGVLGFGLDLDFTQFGRWF